MPPDDDYPHDVARFVRAVALGEMADLLFVMTCDRLNIDPLSGPSPLLTIGLVELDRALPRRRRPAYH